MLKVMGGQPEQKVAKEAKETPETPPQPQAKSHKATQPEGQIKREKYQVETLEDDPTRLRESGPTKAKEAEAAKTPEDSLKDNLKGGAKSLTLSAKHHNNTKRRTLPGKSPNAMETGGVNKSPTEELNRRFQLRP